MKQVHDISFLNFKDCLEAVLHTFRSIKDYFKQSFWRSFCQSFIRLKQVKIISRILIDLKKSHKVLFSPINISSRKRMNFRNKPRASNLDHKSTRHSNYLQDWPRKRNAENIYVDE